MILKKLLNRKEPLNVELKMYLDTSGPLGTCIKHPLVFSLFYHEAENALLNEQLKQKEDYIEKCRAEKKWGSIVWMYERPIDFMHSN